jgi:hypothetical protein
MGGVVGVGVVLLVDELFKGGRVSRKVTLALLTSA